MEEQRSALKELEDKQLLKEEMMRSIYNFCKQTSDTTGYRIEFEGRIEVLDHKEE